jgi:hypothetical protein
VNRRGGCCLPGKPQAAAGADDMADDVVNYKLQFETVSSRADTAAMRPAQRSALDTKRKIAGTRTHQILYDTLNR